MLLFGYISVKINNVSYESKDCTLYFYLLFKLRRLILFYSLITFRLQSYFYTYCKKVSAVAIYDITIVMPSNLEVAIYVALDL